MLLGLFGAALLTLTKRPIVSGILFGCLAYKPQFALVIPVALLAAGQWRAIAAAAGTVIALVAVTSLAFGWDIWLAFAASMDNYALSRGACADYAGEFARDL